MLSISSPTRTPNKEVGLSFADACQKAGIYNNNLNNDILLVVAVNNSGNQSLVSYCLSGQGQGTGLYDARNAFRFGNYRFFPVAMDITFSNIP